MDLCLVGLLLVFLFGWFCCFDCVFDCCVLGLLLCLVVYLMLCLIGLLLICCCCTQCFGGFWFVVVRLLDCGWWFGGSVFYGRWIGFGFVICVGLLGGLCFCDCVFCVDLTGLVVSVGCYASVVLTSGLRVVDGPAWIGLWLLVDCGCVVCVCYAFVFDARL